MLRRSLLLPLGAALCGSRLLLRPKSSALQKSKGKKRVTRRKQTSPAMPHAGAAQNVLEPHEAEEESASTEHDTTPIRDHVVAGDGLSLKSRPSVTWEGTVSSSRHNDGHQRDEGQRDGAVPPPNNGGDNASVVSRTAITNSTTTTQSAATATARKTLVSVLSERQHITSSTDDGGLESAVKHEASVRIERRRSRPVMSDTEIDVGMSERLFPDMPRLTALSEIHHSDCNVVCWDEDSYLASQKRQRSCLHGGGNNQRRAKLAATDTEGAPGNTLSDIDEDNLLAADTDDNNTNLSVVSPTATTPSAVKGDSATAATETTTTTVTQIRPSGATEAPLSTLLHGGSSASAPSSPHSSGITMLPIPPEDVAVLYLFLRKLRGATKDELLNIQTRYQQDPMQQQQQPSLPTTMAHVMEYLHGNSDAGVPPAPSPMMPFSSETTIATAFTFVLYTENCSTQNALGHISALFSVPTQRFMTCHVASKMSSCTVLCAVHSNVVTKEQLLLLNTMRHPGFVLRVSNIRSVDPSIADTDLFSSIARAPVLTEVSMLLRRVSGESVPEIRKRLDALCNVGAIFFCANREVALVRAATDVLHGYYRSAFINGLFRRKAPVELREFLKHPTVAAASRARRVATDSTIRQYLKGYIRSNGDFKAAVQQVPYVLRRKWVNALRSQIWNAMASERIRGGRKMGKGLDVLVGDLVLKPQYREDSALRMMANVKADHLMVCLTEEDAAEASLEDVFIPFFRGVYPTDLIAPEATHHPIMTASALERILRKLHALHLIHGMTDEAKRLLDIRTDVSPMLFRRLILRPSSATYTILEDNVAVRSVHYDAARQLLSPRLALQGIPGDDTGRGVQHSDGDHVGGSGKLVDRTFLLQSTSFAAAKNANTSTPSTTVLKNKTVSDDDAAAAVADAFFAPPKREDYVVLGRAHRDLGGTFVTRAPLAAGVEGFDRVHTIHLHVVCPNGASALTSMLREYFNLGGVLEEATSVLQHKIHRTRRELDVETPWLCAPRFCPACFNTCHDDVSACPEYLRKKSVQQEKTLQLRALQSDDRHPNTVNQLSERSSMPSSLQKVTAAQPGEEHSPADFVVKMLSAVELQVNVRRKSVDGKWGIDFNRQLQWTAVKDAGLLTRIALAGPLRTKEQLEEVAQVLENEGSIISADEAKLLQTLTALASPTPTSLGLARTPMSLSAAKEVLQIGESQGDATTTTSSPSLLSQLKLQLTAVNGNAVASTRDVAAQFVRHKNAMSIQLVLRPVQLLDGIITRVKANKELTSHVPPSDDKSTTPLPTTPVTPQSIVLDHSTMQHIAELPKEVTVVLTKSSAALPWGLALSKSTLALTNIGTPPSLAGGGDDAATRMLIPPITTNEAVRHLLEAHPQLYRICEVEHQTVHSVDDIVRVANEDAGRTSLVLLLRKSTEGFATMRRELPSVAPPPPLPPSSPPKALAPTPTVAPTPTHNHTAQPTDSATSPLLATSVHETLVANLPELWSRTNEVVASPFTVAIHRPRGAQRWGVRLGEGSLWLKRIPPAAASSQQHQQHSAHSSVSAFSPAVARAISDTLQQQQEVAALHGAPPAMRQLWVPFVCFVTGVDQAQVVSQLELTRHMQADGSADSVSLQCLRVPLPLLTVSGVPIPSLKPDDRWGFRLRDADATLAAVDVTYAFGQQLQEAVRESTELLTTAASRGDDNLNHTPLGSSGASQLFPSLVALLGGAATPRQSSSSSRRAETAQTPSTTTTSSILLVDDDDDDDPASPAAPLVAVIPQAHATKVNLRRALLQHWAESQCAPEAIRWEIAAIHVIAARPSGGEDVPPQESYFPNKSTAEASKVLTRLRDQSHQPRYEGATVSFELQQVVAASQE